MRWLFWSAALAAPLLALPAAAQPSSLSLIVADCYTGTAAIEVEVDGRILPLTPAAERDDSVGLCYGAPLSFKPTVQVRLRRGGSERVINLKLTRKTKAVLILAEGMTAKATDREPMFD